jgi:cell shape-determining protein MreC
VCYLLLMKSLRGLLITLVLISAFIVFILYRDWVANEFLTTRGIIECVFDKQYTYRGYRNMLLENESLQSQVALMKWGRTSSDTMRVARVYSHYPFNDKNRILIDVGENEGIKEGMPVLAKEGVLLGKIMHVTTRVSEVQTVFDPLWKSSVVIGEGRVKAMLQGANNPRLELIPKEAVIGVGEKISNVSPEFPIGLYIGDIRITKEDEKKVWQIAEISIPYSIEDIDTVSVVTNFP